MSIALYDDFANIVGAFPNYTTYDTSQAAALAGQRHVNIRSFEPTTLAEPYTIFVLDSFTLTTLDGLTMTQIESGESVRANENWSNGTVGPQVDRQYFNGLSLSCSSGSSSTSSITAQAVNLTAFHSGDYISVSLPAFPLSSLNLSSTFLDVSSDSSGNFAAGVTDSVAFSTSTTTLVNGDCEARFPLSVLSHANLGAVTAIRFRVQATATCTFRVLALRCLASTWRYAPVDQDTLYGRLGATVPPSGSVTQPYTFPVASAPVSPSGWPILLRSDGSNGPALVDTELGVFIQTGFNTAQNTFTTYLREMSQVVRTVNNLTGTSMSQLAALGQMPDYTPGKLNDFATSRYLAVTIQWGSSGAVHIRDQSGTSYDFNLSLGAQTNYYALLSLQANSLRLQIYPASANGAPAWSMPVFDSTAIIDDSFIKRRRGRIGWSAQFNEGSTYVRQWRPRRTVYAEYRSAPLVSSTPTEGARIYPSSSADVELYTGATATAGAVVTPDVTHSTSGQCLRVQCSGTIPLQGILTSPTRFENFYDTEISFSVLAPATTNLTALLAGEGRLIQLYIPPFPSNHWTPIVIPLATIAPTAVPGPYGVYIVQAQTGQNTWYIDFPSIHTRSVSWQGRGQANDPWLMNDPRWVKFGGQINDPSKGILFGRGTSMQVRGQALTQDGSIAGVQVLPRYSTLGRFVWSDQTPHYGSGPTPILTATLSSSLTVSANGTNSTAPNGIAAYHWSFGDGAEAFGVTTSHVYSTAGTYTIGLTIIDALGLQATSTQLFTAS